MSVTRADYDELMERARKAAAGPMVPSQHTNVVNMMLRRAAVDASALTGHPAFDNFLAYIQARINEIEAETALLREQLFSPAQFTVIEITRLQSMCVRNDMIVATLTDIMAWPRKALAAASTEESPNG